LILIPGSTKQQATEALSSEILNEDIWSTLAYVVSGQMRAATLAEVNPSTSGAEKGPHATSTCPAGLWESFSRETRAFSSFRSAVDGTKRRGSPKRIMKNRDAAFTRKKTAQQRFDSHLESPCTDAVE
jgi:hypothetical protein